MSFQTVYRARAFSPGADLWIVPDLANSNLAKRVDWYLNFQLAKAELHRTRPLSPELRKIIIENDMGLPEPEDCSQKPLMVAASAYFPTHRIVLIKLKSSLQDWVREIEEIWMKLGQPKLRIFMPQDLSVEEFQKLWKAKLSPADELGLVPH